MDEVEATASHADAGVSLPLSAVIGNVQVSIQLMTLLHCTANICDAQRLSNALFTLGRCTGSLTVLLVLVFILLAILARMFVRRWTQLATNSDMRTFVDKDTRRVLLVIAHPDDECEAFNRFHSE